MRNDDREYQDLRRGLHFVRPDWSRVVFAGFLKPTPMVTEIEIRSTWVKKRYG